MNTATVGGNRNGTLGCGSRHPDPRFRRRRWQLEYRERGPRHSVRIERIGDQVRCGRSRTLRSHRSQLIGGSPILSQPVASIPDTGLCEVREIVVAGSGAVQLSKLDRRTLEGGYTAPSYPPSYNRRWASLQGSGAEAKLIRERSDPRASARQDRLSCPKSQDPPGFGLKKLRTSGGATGFSE